MTRWVSECLATAAYDQVEGSPRHHVLDVRDLVDKMGNQPSAIKAKVDEGVRRLRRGEKVVVCCDYGRSRSNAVAAAILSNFEKVDFDCAVRRVLAATGENGVQIDVLSAVRKAVERNGSSQPSMAVGAKAVLVTGATGFIGATLIRRIARTRKVVQPTRRELNLATDAVKLDLLVKRLGVAVLVHLANPRVYTTNASMGETLTMLKNVLDVSAENGLFLVYLSTWEVFSGYRSTGMWADETLAPCPGATYGQTKLLCETLIHQFRRRRRLRCTILRSSPVYGIGSDRPKFIWNFLHKAMRNKTITAHRYRNGLPCLDLLYVDDLCSAIVASVERRAAGTIHVGTGVAASTTDVARRIIELTGSTSTVRHVEIDGYASNVVMDVARARAVLDWRPSVDLTQGLTTVVRARAK